VRANLRANPVLERRDDLSARRVVLGIRGEDQHDVQRQPDGIALDLDVALLEDVEEPDLDLAGEVGQFVDREDPPVRPRQQAVVHGQVVREPEPGTRRLDRVHVADDVRDRDIRGGQLLDVPGCARQPGHRKRIALALRPLAAGRADGSERVVVDFTARDDGDFLVQEFHESA